MLKTITTAVLDLLLPPRCLVCNVYLTIPPGSAFCELCANSFRELEYPLCRICGEEVGGQLNKEEEAPLCGSCLKSLPPFALGRSLYEYNDELQHLVQLLKYKKDRVALSGIAELVKTPHLSLFSDCDLIVPVPLHIKRLRQRGFNQAALLASLFFPDQQAKLDSQLLVRLKNSGPQSLLGGRDRRKRLRNTFGVNGNRSISGATICVVDDVYTTGTTVTRCSEELLRAGAAKVKILTLARVISRRNCR